MADPTITDLDPTAIAQAEALLIEFLKPQYPSLDLSEGRVLRNLLIRPAAIFHVLNQTNIEALQNSQSMLTVSADPASADPAIVDQILANYRITRNPGAQATGTVTIIIANLLTTPVAQNASFVAGGLTFTTLSAFVGVVTSAAVLSSQQRLITKRTDGTYSFIIDVTAADVGEQYNIKHNTRFDSVSPEPPGMIDAVAASDFTGGSSAETNAQLVERFKLALSPQVFSGRINIESLLKNEFPLMKAISIIGFGDAEMIRDRHNIFSISTGGKADLYFRSQATPETIAVTKSAVLIDKATKTWQLAIDREAAPGFYAVTGVRLPTTPATAASYEITNEVRGLNLTPDTDEFVPDIANLVEGGGSRYQTAVIQFSDTDTDVSALTPNVSKQDYVVSILYMPQIKDVQVVASNRSVRNPQADYLIRAPVPAFAAVTLKVAYTDEVDAPDVDTIKRGVADRVNGINFALGQLPASVIHDAVYDAAGETGIMVISPVDLSCRILKPGGGFVDLRSADGLVIPNLPAEAVSSRTVNFFMTVDDVDVELQKVSVLPV